MILSVEESISVKVRENVLNLTSCRNSRLTIAVKMNLQTSKHDCYDYMFSASVTFLVSLVVVVTIMVKLLVNYVVIFYYSAKSYIYIFFFLDF